MQPSPKKTGPSTFSYNIIRLTASLALCTGLYAPVASSETVTIPLGQQGDHWNIERPRTGISKAQVLNQYGEPTDRTGPVGDPPIYTWHYAQFKVYFESDRVIHTVVKHDVER